MATLYDSVLIKWCLWHFVLWFTVCAYHPLHLHDFLCFAFLASQGGQTPLTDETQQIGAEVAFDTSHSFQDDSNVLTGRDSETQLEGKDRFINEITDSWVCILCKSLSKIIFFWLSPPVFLLVLNLQQVWVLSAIYTGNYVLDLWWRNATYWSRRIKNDMNENIVS